jgi:hypothetical protein
MLSLLDRQKIFAQNVAKLLFEIVAKSESVTLGEAYRTKEQAELYAKEGKGIIDSQHCKRLAIDIDLFQGETYLTDEKSYEPFGIYWESLHPDNVWGGRFKRGDGNHYEMKG